MVYARIGSGTHDLKMNNKCGGNTPIIMSAASVQETTSVSEVSAPPANFVLSEGTG